MHVPQDSMWQEILKTFCFLEWTKQGLNKNQIEREREREREREKRLTETDGNRRTKGTCTRHHRTHTSDRVDSPGLAKPQKKRQKNVYILPWNLLLTKNAFVVYVQRDTGRAIISTNNPSLFTLLNTHVPTLLQECAWGFDKYIMWRQEPELGFRSAQFVWLIGHDRKYYFADLLWEKNTAEWLADSADKDNDTNVLSDNTYFLHLIDFIYLFIYLLFLSVDVSLYTHIHIHILPLSHNSRHHERY